MATIILTGDVNLMNVDDPTVPFSRMRQEFQAADLVFSNLECCLYDSPSGHAVENEGFFASPAAGGEALRQAGISAVGIANNVNYGDAAITASIGRLDELGIAHTGAGMNVAMARAPIVMERHGLRLRLPAAKLGLLADQPRGGAEFHRHCRHPCPHRLSGADAQDTSGHTAAQPPRNSPAHHHLGGPGLSARLHR